MKKNISSLLQRGNLTPKERYLLLIQNEEEKARTGKEILTEADEQALLNWQAKTNEEVREWNRYNGGWKLNGRAGIEAEFIYMQTLAENYRKNIISTELAIYPFYREHLNALQALKKIKIVDIKEAIEITNKQREQKLKDGLDFDYAIYQFAFESLSDEIRKDILTLDPEAEYESSYLDDEETTADLLNGKNELTKEAKEKYAELVADRSYNKFAKEYQLHGSFANLPIMDIAKKWAKDKGIKPRQKDYERLKKMNGEVEKKGLKKEFEKDIKHKSDEEWLLENNLKEILEDYARDNKTTIKKILKETLLKWLEEDLPYPPLVISEDKKTYDEDTKLPHNELFKEWLKAKDKARTTLQKLIDKGELKVKDITEQDEVNYPSLKREDLLKKYLGKQYTRNKIITGESLYNFKDDFKFIKEFKERVDRYDANAGLIYADNDPEHKSGHLDQELLIAEKDKDGKPAIVSIFGMSLREIERALRPHYFKEVEKNGETYLEFERDIIKKVFKETRQSLIDGYAKLLAFQEIFRKLNKIYEAETDHLLNQRIQSTSEFIDQHNFSLENALKDLTGFGIGFGLYKKPLKMKENLFIKRDKIAPDAETKREWTERFKEIFNDF